jgi:O-methyltransferase
MIKNMIRRGLAAWGYEIVPSSASWVSYDNFVNLANAYELRLRQDDDLLPPDAVRPRLLARLLGTPPSEAYFVIQALHRSRQVDGDVCEFGVAQGETSALIANEMAPWHDKKLHLFDSFEGLPRPSEQDQLKDDVFGRGSMDGYTGLIAYPEDMVRRRLQAVSFPADRCVIHKGYVDRVLATDTTLPRRVSFAYVDFDFYDPIRLALNFLDSVTAPGAIIVVDDYDYFSTGAKTAVDEFVDGRNGSGVCWERVVPDAGFGHFAVLTRTA